MSTRSSSGSRSEPPSDGSRPGWSSGSSPGSDVLRGPPGSGRIERVGPYLLLGRLGAGGMGTVYRVRHEELGVERALKVLARPGDARGAARFARESGNLGRVHHPNVVRIHESGEVQGRPYFVMDLVAGEPLDELLARGRLPWREAAELALGIARGVAALQREGILHRDLKPQNVVVAAGGAPVVIDLGLAVAPERDDRLTRTGAVMGTFGYMAPEQFEGKQATERTDVYALGLITFELLTGTPAFPAESSIQAITRRMLADARPRPTALQPDLPRGFDGLCGRALARMPDERHADAAAFADELERLLVQPGLSGRETRWRVAGALAVLGAVALALVLLVASGRPAEVAGDAPGAPAGELPPGSAPSPPSPSPPGEVRRIALSPAKLEEGAAALRLLRREREPRRRHAAASEWLERFPDHPDEGAADALRSEAQLHFPRHVLRHEGLTRGAFLSAARALTVDRQGAIRLWDVERGEEVARWDRRWPLNSVAPLPGGEAFVVGGYDGFVALIDATSGEPLRSRREAGDGDAKLLPLALDVSPAGDLLAVAWSSQEIGLFTLPALEPVRRLGPHAAAVWLVAFSPDGARLLSGSGVLALGAAQPAGAGGHGRDEAARVWDVATGAQVARVPFPALVQAGAWTADGTAALVATTGGRALLLDGSDGAPLGELHGEGARSSPWDASPPAHSSGITGLAYVRQGRRIVTTSAGAQELDRELRWWSAGTLAELRPPTRLPSWFEAIAVSPDGRLLLGWTRDGTAEVWELPPE